nr:hypothetical protein [uncultured Noviherbaspirillum sp.]
MATRKHFLPAIRIACHRDLPSGPEVCVALTGDDAIHVAFCRKQIEFVLRIFTERNHGAAGQPNEESTSQIDKNLRVARAARSKTARRNRSCS